MFPAQTKISLSCIFGWFSSVKKKLRRASGASRERERKKKKKIKPHQKKTVPLMVSPLSSFEAQNLLD